MALDPSIALQAKGLQLNDPLQQYAQVAQIQNAQNQNQVSQMQIAQMRRDTDAMDKIQAHIVANGGPSDPAETVKALMGSGNLKYMELGQSMQQKLNDKADFARIMGGGGAAMPQGQPAPSSEPYQGYNESIGINALAPQAAAPANAMGMEQRINAAYAVGTPQALAWAKAQQENLKPHIVGAGSSVWDASKNAFVGMAPERTDTDLSRNYDKAVSQGFNGSIFDYQARIAQAGRTPAQPRAESAPVAVVDPKTGRPVYVSREQAIQGGMAPASAMESLAPKEIQKREAALPAATSAVKGFENKADSFIADLEKLSRHPGLDQITGIAAGRIPGITSEGRSAQALYDKVVAKGGFQALQDLRDASKTGGALGNVSNQEGKQLVSSFSAINRTQDAKDVREAIAQAIANVQGSKTRMREAYDSTYSYKPDTQRAPAAPAAGGVEIDHSNPLLR